MDNDVLDAYNDINCDAPLLPEDFAKLIEGGPKSTEYTGLVHQLSNELKLLCSLEESVSATEGPDDASSFLLELSSFLKELGCPYTSLMTGHMSSRLQSTEDRLLLLEYLISEVMAARMLTVDHPKLVTDNVMEVTIQESPTAKDLKDILIALNINKPPANVSMEQLFSKLESKLREVIQKEGPNYFGRPLYNKAVTEKQWKEIEDAYKRLCDEYKMRRDMLITRLDCTIQSFEWSGDGGKKREQIQAVYKPLRATLKSSSALKLSDFLAARSTLAISKKTSDASVRVNTKSQVNKVIIGKVPDRGGRPSEQEPPPPEMPSWQQQRSSGGGSGFGGKGGGSGFGSGNRVQGNWNQGGGGAQTARNQSYQDNKNQGGYSDNRNQGYQENKNQGGYNDNRNQGYHDNRNQGYQENRNQSYHDNRNQGYQNNKNQGYQDNRTNDGSYQNYQGYQGNQNYSQNNQYQQGYQNQNYQQSYQDQGYQGQGGYRNQNQNQGKGRYQNEHDDRANNYSRNGGGGGGGRGRSNYNRGGRH